MGKKGGSGRLKNNSQAQGEASGRNSTGGARGSGSTLKKQQSWRPVASSKSNNELSPEPDTKPVTGISFPVAEDPPKEDFNANVNLHAEPSQQLPSTPSELRPASSTNSAAKQTMKEKLEYRRRLVEGDADEPSEDNQLAQSSRSNHQSSAASAVMQGLEAQREQEAQPQREADKDDQDSKEENQIQALKNEESRETAEAHVTKHSTDQTEPEEEARPNSDTVQPLVQPTLPLQNVITQQNDTGSQPHARVFQCSRGFQCFRALFRGR